MKLVVDQIECALGTIVLIAREGCLCWLGYADRRKPMMAALAARYAPLELANASNPFGLSDALHAYLAGDLDAISCLAVETGGTRFQRAVWAALRRIPPGRAESYSDLAREIGHPRAARAVGAANGQNPVAIVVPCHRLIGAHGALTGYAGGIWRKRWLLDHEGAEREVASRTAVKRA